MNRLLKELGDAGLVEVENANDRPFNYQLTVEGRTRYRRLDREDSQGVVARFRALEERILARMNAIRTTGVERILCYGAGEILGVALPLAPRAGLEVVGVLDDDPARHGVLEDGIAVMGADALETLAAQGVLITTYRHAETIRGRLGDEVRPGYPVFEL